MMMMTQKMHRAKPKQIRRRYKAEFNDEAVFTFPVRPSPDTHLLSEQQILPKTLVQLLGSAVRFRSDLPDAIANLVFNHPGASFALTKQAA